MLVVELKSALNALFSRVDRQGDFLDILRSLARAYDGVKPAYLDLVASAPNEAPQRLTSIRLQLGQSLEVVKRLDVSVFINGIENLKAILEDFFRSMMLAGHGEAEGKRIHYFRQIELLSAGYQRLIQSSFSSAAAIVLFESAKSLLSMLQTDLDSLHLIEVNLGPAIAIVGANEASLSIQFIGEISAIDPMAKLQEIQACYDAAAVLARINPNEHALRFAVIEVGSLFVEIIGDGTIILLLTQVIRATAGILNQHLTIGGKLDSEQFNIDHIRKLAELRNDLRNQGISTDDADVEIASGLNDLTKNVLKIMRGQRKIKINGLLIEVAIKSVQNVLSDPTTVKHLVATTLKRITAGDKDAK